MVPGRSAKKNEVTIEIGSGHDVVPRSMKKNEVISLLKENQNERGIAHWKKRPRELESDYLKKKFS